MTAAYLRGPELTNPRDDIDKRFANARARLALAGYQLHIVDDGPGPAGYMVARWDRSRTLPDLEAVEAFIRQAGGPAA